MADSTLAALGAHTPVIDANSSYIESAGVAKKVAASVWKTYCSLSPTLVTPALGTVASGDVSACVSTGQTLTSPTLVTPALGTPASGDISACVSTNQVLTTPDLGTPSALVLTNASGTLTSPTFVTPVLGVPSSGDISACTGNPALAITNMTGTATNLTLVTPALGTPSALVLTNATGGVVDSLAAHIAGGTSVEVTATVGGGTTGLIPATAEFVSVVCGDANHQISLPAAVDGKVIRILGGGANDFEVISAVAGDKINNVVVGATNEAALLKTTLYTLVYDLSTENWFMDGRTATGGVEVPVIPDGL